MPPAPAVDSPYPAAPRSDLRRGGRNPPRREVLRFLTVGGTCIAVTCAINYLLKLTVLTAKPVTALVIATIAATLLSYALNRQWTFRARGGRALVHEAVLFFGVNGIATAINAAPLWIARYLLDLRVPEVSRLAQEARRKPATSPPASSSEPLWPWCSGSGRTGNGSSPPPGPPPFGRWSRLAARKAATGPVGPVRDHRRTAGSFLHVGVARPGGG